MSKEQNNSILIVDDDKVTIGFFEVMLSRMGFTVSLAESGERGLDILREVEDDTIPGLILLDNVMPGITGWDFARIVKSDEEYSHVRHVPIIMFSALDSVQDKVEGFEVGVDDYITKPFNFLEVLARIRVVFRHTTLEKEILSHKRFFTLLESLHSLEKSIQNFRNNAIERSGKESERHVNELDTILDELQDISCKVEEIPNHFLKVKEDIETRFRNHFTDWKENFS